MSVKIFTLGELFCGPGGIAYGATKLANVEGAQIVHTWATDYDPDTCETYRNNICTENNRDSVICQNIHTLSFGTLPRVNALAFGFPCNDFSVVGKHKGLDGKYGPLYTYCAQALEEFHPDWFLAENVGGIRSSNNREAFRLILKTFNEKGYRIYPHYYHFEDYGVPQTRHRVIIVGIKDDLNYEFHVPAPTTLDHPKTCKEALTTPPISEDLSNNERFHNSKTVIQRLAYMKPGENAFTADLPDSLELHVNGAKISNIYKKLDPNQPSYTVTGSGGGGTYMYHWEEPRALTNRERARLQTFPDSFVFSGNMQQVRRQIGMAVPPLGAQIIAEAILKTFLGIPYDCVPCNLKPPSV